MLTNDKLFKYICITVTGIFLLLIVSMPRFSTKEQLDRGRTKLDIYISSINLDPKTIKILNETAVEQKYTWAYVTTYTVIGYDGMRHQNEFRASWVKKEVKGAIDDYTRRIELQSGTGY